VLNRIFSTQSTSEWLTRLETSGIPHAPILDVAGAFAQPQVADGDFVGETTAPHGTVRMMRTPLRIDGTRPTIRSGPRRLGEDTAVFFTD
jgi:crotonobetainyl-CoA:carnitine CoA-transferase CaiB-like acyl-CoA transferase